jgi:hypothetical protein
MADATERAATAYDDSFRNDIPERSNTIQRVRHEGSGSFSESRDKATAAPSYTEKDYGVRSSEGVAWTTASTTTEA